MSGVNGFSKYLETIDAKSIKQATDALDKMAKAVKTESDKYQRVNHPAHYNRDGAMECIEEMVVLFGEEETKSFCKLNAWKYRYRAADKGGDEDMKKSDFYIRMYKELCDRQSQTEG